MAELAAANLEESRVRSRAPGAGLEFLGYPGVTLERPDATAGHYLRYVKRVYGITPSPKIEAAE